MAGRCITRGTDAGLVYYPEHIYSEKTGMEGPGSNGKGTQASIGSRRRCAPGTWQVLTAATWSSIGAGHWW